MKSLYLLLTQYSFSGNSIRATFVDMRKVIKVSNVSKCFFGLSILTQRSEFSSIFNSARFSISCIVEKLSKLGDCTYNVRIRIEFTQLHWSLTNELSKEPLQILDWSLSLYPLRIEGISLFSTTTSRTSDALDIFQRRIKFLWISVYQGSLLFIVLLFADQLSDKNQVNWSIKCLCFQSFCSVNGDNFLWTVKKHFCVFDHWTNNVQKF